MNFQELAILLPCHSLEDFPQHHEGEAADGLLANWTALWHPALLANQERGPAWYRADDPPETLAGRLLLVPSVSGPELPADFAEKVASQDGCLIAAEANRPELIERIFAAGEIAAEIEPQLVADFFALSYCYLQIQLLTRQMRYSSNLDEGHFFQQVLAGARAAKDGDSETAHAKLAACFDLLAEERDHFYSVDAYLIDLTLLDKRILPADSDPPSWAGELASDVPLNLLATAATLERMSQRSPATFASISAAISAGRIGLAGGEYEETRLPLQACESVLAAIRRGQECYELLLGRGPEVFGRRQFGYSPFVPQVISKLGFTGALHFSLEEGSLPLGSQAKTRWEGCDGSAVDALSRIPADAARPESLLGFAHRLGESMDMDHVATLIFAHWPGKASPFYEDLRRCAKFGPALGRFVTIEEYFRETYMPGHSDRFAADGYVSPYLKRSVREKSSNPISVDAQSWSEESVRLSRSGMRMLLSALGGRNSLDANELSDSREVANREVQAASDLVSLARDFAERLPRSANQETGYLVVNPLSSARRVPVDVSGLDKLPAVGRPIFATVEEGSEKWAIVDVPPMGFAWVAGSPVASGKPKPGPALAEDRSRADGTFVLRNEYFEVLIDPQTGGIRSLKDYRHRINRLSQQVALRRSARRPDAQREHDAVYSTMAAESVVVTRSNSVVGEIVAAGRFVGDGGEAQGEFTQTLRLYRGCRTLELEIELKSLNDPGPDPWNSYYAARFAWSDEAAEVLRGVHELRQPTDSGRCETPNYFEIDTGTTRTAVLTGGLCHHRRTDHRMIDSLLVVRGEKERRFRIGIAVDAPSTLEQARQLLAPVNVVRQTAGIPLPASSGWLFHFDAKNVSVTSWEPLFDGDAAIGARIRILESMGRSVRARLSCFQSIRTARKVDFLGQSLGECQVNDGQAQLDLAASEWAAFEFWWGEALHEGSISDDRDN